MKKSSAMLLLVLSLAWSCSNSDTVQYPRYSLEPVSEAVPFAEGIISTDDNSEFALAFSPDGNKVYFSRRAAKEKQKIYEADFVKGKWTIPKAVEFSTDRDEAPSITPDGKYFFFGSERPIPGRPSLGNFDMNIWMMKKEGEYWSAPEVLPSPINEVQEEGESWPSSNANYLSTHDSEMFYFTTMYRGSNAVKLYRTSFRDGAFTEPVEQKGLFEDEKYWVYSATVSPDGKYLVFNSFGHPEGQGGEDIYVARKEGDSWSKARPIGLKVNSKDEEGGARFSRDGRYFFFTRAEDLGNYEYGNWDIYYIETEYLKLDSLFE